MINDETIKNRISARELARVAAGLVVLEAGGVPPDAQNAFWDEIHKMLPATADKIADAAPVEPFTDRQARAFGRTRIPFGKFAGTCVDEVPLDYLERLCDPQPFILSLKRYLASQRVQQESDP